MNSINMFLAMTPTFEYPLLLLVLIPGVILGLLPFFLLKKERRRNRNRITSLVLHMIILILATLVLSGFKFVEENKPLQRETIVVVDISSSMDGTEDEAQKYIDAAIKVADDKNRVGVVTFGYRGKLAQAVDLKPGDTFDLKAKKSEITSDADEAAATNIGKAIYFAYSKIDAANRQGSRLIVITDGVETDDVGLASTEARYAAGNGVSVDMVYLKNDGLEKELQITAIETPPTIVPNTPFEVQLSVLNFGSSASAQITLTDCTVTANGGLVEQSANTKNYTKTIAAGQQTIALEEFKFDTAGMHVLKAEITSDGDAFAQNNTYYSIVNLDVDQSILLIGAETQTAGLKAYLTELGYQADSVTESNVPSSLNGYSVAVLMNTSLTNLPQGYDTVIKNFVTAGGGLLTTGGENAYINGNVKDTQLEEVLPVTVTDSSTSNAVLIVLDRSNSMFFSMNNPVKDQYPAFSETRMYFAQQSLLNCLSLLGKNDYLGLLTFNKNAETRLALTKNIVSIRNAINGLPTAKGSSGTSWTAAFSLAQSTLASFNKAENKHLIFVTDADVVSSSDTGYEAIANSIYATGTKISFITIGDPGLVNDELLGKLGSMATNFGGLLKSAKNSTEMAEYFEDVFDNAIVEPVGQIRDYQVSANAVPLLKDIDTFPIVRSYNGGSVKTGAVEALFTTTDKGVEVPLYSSWYYGANAQGTNNPNEIQGKVGSFMSDLGAGGWANNYLTDANGRELIKTIIQDLMPTVEVNTDLQVEWVDNNYTKTLEVTGGTLATEQMRYTAPNIDSIFGVNMRGVDNEEPNLAGGYYVWDVLLANQVRSENDDLDLSKGGLLSATVYFDEGGSTPVAKRVYTTFSYSKEYDFTYMLDANYANTLESNVKAISASGRGIVIDDPTEITSVVDTNDTAPPIEHDPSVILLIIAGCLFILDVAARKFNFWWPHEIIKGKRSTDAVV